MVLASTVKSQGEAVENLNFITAVASFETISKSTGLKQTTESGRGAPGTGGGN